MRRGSGLAEMVAVLVLVVVKRLEGPGIYVAEADGASKPS